MKTKGKEKEQKVNSEMELATQDWGQCFLHLSDQQHDILERTLKKL